MIFMLITLPGLLMGAGLVSLISTSADLSSILTLGIAICANLSVALLYRPTRWYAAAITLLLPAALAFLLQPVCRPMSDFEISRLRPPVELRSDRDIYIDVYQQQDEKNWNYCTTRLRSLTKG